jgi:hypothetical protein
MAGGSGFDLRPGEKKLPATQAGARHAHDAAWNKCRSHGYEASDWVSLDDSTPLLLNG